MLIRDGARIHSLAASQRNNGILTGEDKMALSAEQKESIIKEYALGDGDTGSPEVQVALLTANINQLQDHFKDQSYFFISPARFLYAFTFQYLFTILLYWTLRLDVFWDPLMRYLQEF